MIMPILTVNDVDESVAFYKDKLGFQHDMTMAPEGKSIFAHCPHGREVVLGLGTDEATPPNLRSRRVSSS